METPKNSLKEMIPCKSINGQDLAGSSVQYERETDFNGPGSTPLYHASRWEEKEGIKTLPLTKPEMECRLIKRDEDGERRTRQSKVERSYIERVIVAETATSPVTTIFTAVCMNTTISRELMVERDKRGEVH